ncbi:MAG: hypothetical protein ACXWLR_05405 [Myxococcales bacterium]
MAPAATQALPPPATDAGAEASAADSGTTDAVAGSGAVVDGGPVSAAPAECEWIDAEGHVLGEEADTRAAPDLGPTPWLDGQVPESVRRTWSCEGVDAGTPPTTAEIVASTRLPHTVLEDDRIALVRRWVCAGPGATLKALVPIAEHRDDADGGVETAHAVSGNFMPISGTGSGARRASKQ